jgi:hypothetical protein
MPRDPKRSWFLEMQEAVKPSMDTSIQIGLVIKLTENLTLDLFSLFEACQEVVWLRKLSEELKYHKKVLRTSMRTIKVA